MSMAKQMEFMLEEGVKGIPLPQPNEWTARYTKTELLYLEGPLITFGPTGVWSYPEWLKEVILPARLMLVMQGERELSTEEEALGYLCTASLTVPINHDWSQIFLWLAERIMPHWKKLPEVRTFWKSIGYEDPAQLNPTQQQDLVQLRRWLRRQVEKNAKRAKSKRR
jgi:hypothetical protein